MSAAPPPARRDLERTLAELDRRAFFRLCGAAAAAGWLPSGCSRPALAPPAGLELRVLTPRTYAVFNAAAQRIVGPRGASLIADGRVDPARTADAWLARAPSVAEPLTTALWVVEWAVFPVLGKLRPFTALDGAGQDRILAELLGSRLALKRALFNALKSFACLTFYAAPETHALIGYPGPFASSEVAIADAMT